MFREVQILLSAVLLGGCATSKDSYLNTISIALPRENYSEVSDKLETGRDVPTVNSAPFPDDFPPSRIIVMKDPRSYPSFTEPRYAFPASNEVRLYDLKNIGEGRTIQTTVKRLKKALLERRPTAGVGYPNEDLPDYPTHNAGFLVQDKVSYHDYTWGSGVFYLAQFTQSTGNFPNNEELSYQFQGLSKDGRIYVSAKFRVTHPILPASIETVPKSDTIDDDAEKMAKRLDQQPDDSFSPGLPVMRSWIESIRIP